MTYADPRWLRIRRRHAQAPTQQGLAVLSEHLQTRYREFSFGLTPPTASSSPHVAGARPAEPAEPDEGAAMSGNPLPTQWTETKEP
jgi:hypothetical protein